VDWVGGRAERDKYSGVGFGTELALSSGEVCLPRRGFGARFEKFSSEFWRGWLE
jgi:hypothetical protein